MKKQKLVAFSKKRILGVPLAGIAVLLIPLVAFGAWALATNVPSSVEVIGGDIALWQDAGMNITLSDLTFQTTRGGESNIITIWAENTGTDTIYLGLANEGLAGNITQYVNGSTLVSAEPARVQVAAISPAGYVSFNLSLTAGENVALGDYDFTTIIEASETEFV